MSDQPLTKKRIKIRNMSLQQLEDAIGHAIQHKQQNSKHYKHLQSRLHYLQSRSQSTVGAGQQEQV